MKKFIKKILKKSRLIRRLHCAIIDNYNRNKERNVNIDEIIPLVGTNGIDNGKIRLNLLIPTLKKEFVFGGISTALKLFNEVAGNDFDKRIILTDSDVHTEDLDILEGAKIVKMNEKSAHSFQVIAGNERRKYQLPVTENDIFIATSWWSAYILLPFIRWQNKQFGCNHKLVYLIQDYEPGFQPWSSRYILADSTYKSGEETIAVFNTKILMDFFRNEGYTFFKEYYFEPVLNNSLKNILFETKNVLRKKKLIVYGRASVDRNCFELIIGSLRVLVENYKQAVEWEFVSMGENHPSIELGKGKILTSLGKLSLEGYAQEMLEASVGLSLMVSPHPSYPPLEMSTFGVITITNTYKNKELSNFNDNIRSIDNCNFENIANELATAMSLYTEYREPAINDSYVYDETSFSNMCKKLHKELY